MHLTGFYRTLGLTAASLFLSAAAFAASSFPDPTAKASAPAAKTATAVLAGGCFWGMEGVYEHTKGVLDTQVGYAGGTKKTATYKQVSEGNTGHAESIKITYDPAQISYGQILKIFFSIAHDPTTLNRQHYDVGTQYRSSIFFSSAATSLNGTTAVVRATSICGPSAPGRGTTLPSASSTARVSSTVPW